MAGSYSLIPGLKIMVDIDGVLARISSYLLALNALTGLSCKEEDVIYYSAVYDIYGREATGLIFSAPDVVLGMEGYRDNIRRVREWAKYFDVFIFTARPLTVRAATLAWLKRYRVERAVQGVYFEDKVAWVKINRPDIMVDDCAELLLKASPYIQRAYLVNRPWNAGIPGPFYRVDNLKEIAL